MIMTLSLFGILAGLLLAFGAYIGVLEWLARRRTRKLSPLLGVVLPPEEDNE